MNTPAPTKPLTHRVAGRAQVGLSYFFLSGFFAVVAAQGLGYLKTDMLSQLSPIVMLVMTFWFQRQRTSVDDPHQTNPTTAPQAQEPPK